YQSNGSTQLNGNYTFRLNKWCTNSTTQTKLRFYFTSKPNDGPYATFYDVELNEYNQSTTYPGNVTIYVNNKLALNYGAANASLLDHTVRINFTTNLSTIPFYPTRIDVLANTSGGVILSDLLIEDTSRNFTFNFYDERDGSTFKLNDTNTTLRIY